MDFSSMDWNSFVPIYQFCIAPAIIAAGIGLGSTLLGNLFNKSQSDEANDLIRQNNEFQQQQYLDEKQYKRELQERLFEREDNSYQRTVDDITKSGLSPLAINGTNQAGNVVSSAQPPELQQINPFQAQNLDFGQLIDAIQSEDTRKLEEEKLDFEKQKYMSDKEYRENQATEQTRQFNEDLALQQAQFNETVKNNFNLNKQQQEQLDNLKKQTEIQKNLADLQESKAKNEAIVESVTKLGGKIKWYSPSQKEECEQAQATYNAGLAEAWKRANEILSEKTSESKSKNKSKSGSIGGKIPKTPINGNIDVGWSNSESESYSQDTYNKAYGVISEYVQTHDYPLVWYK